MDANRRPKVVMALYMYHPYVSGLSVYAKRIAEGLVQAGYEVTVLTSRHDKTLPKRESINGVNVIRRPVLFQLGKGVIMPTFWLDMIWHAHKNDYINPHLPLPDSALASLFIPKKKIITTYHCDIYLGPKLLDRLITFVSISLMRLQMKRSSVIIPSTLDYFKHCKMSKYIAKATPVYPPISDTEFSPVSHEALFDRLKVKKNEIKIGFVGRIVYEKGIKYLLEAIPLIKNEIKDFKVIIAGDYEKVAGGSIKEQLDHYLELYPENILLTGYLSDEDRNRFYSGLDVFVLPSIDPLEAFGMVQVEAMLCGTPVVASDLPGVREVVGKTGYGRISKRKDPADIAKQIVEVVKHPQKYKPVREQVVKHFGLEGSVGGYTRIMHL